MKARIVDRSYANLTGDYGGTAFVDGVSIHDYPEHHFDRIANSIKVVNHETGEQIGIMTRMLASKTKRMDSYKTEELARATKIQGDRLKVATSKPTSEPRKVYTEEELGQIVEDKGITGLREIAAPLNVRARSIPDLIRAILEAQGAEQGLSINKTI